MEVHSQFCAKVIAALGSSVSTAKPRGNNYVPLFRVSAVQRIVDRPPCFAFQDLATVRDAFAAYMREAITWP